jgi:hypothetical protein
VAASVEPADHVTEWTVTEWTVTYEAKRSASKNWAESTETHEAKCSGMAKN